jgi:hypothetical protein
MDRARRSIKSKPPSYYEPRVREFLAKQGAQTMNFLSSTEGDVLLESLKINATPTVLIYDHTGRLRTTHVGFGHPEFDLEVRDFLRSLLAVGQR